MVGDVSILITGGAGFIGSHTVLVLLENGYDIIVLDNLVNAWKDDSEQIPEVLQRVERLTGKKITFYQVDLCDQDALSDVFNKVMIIPTNYFNAIHSAEGYCIQIIVYPIQCIYCDNTFCERVGIAQIDSEWLSIR
ncbi:UDP-glucose 4-epimerase-like [Nilaparvata lugens]|uniref:UDP-glucose 4-epimerase-like n=1 Tax=Nilaparvata lugens TaxID=108931 RepID=UPI00193DF4F8|nr:UDP-glucose 4-epimerase-like [Nilaparvata lugens]